MKKEVIAAGIVAVGIALAGLCVGLGLKYITDSQRTVDVKGLSTREVKADYAVWPLSYSVESNDIRQAYAELNRTTEAVRAFFMEKGFSAEDIQQGNTQVTDQWANYYNVRPQYRYCVSTSLIISTKNVDLVIESQGCQSELMSKGIIVSSNDWSLDYQFNGLNDLKPSMIEEATKNARAVAQKFAEDANCSLGSICTARQGQFSIESDPYQPWVKHIRVVTTVSYFLN